MKNIVENQGIKTDKPLPMSYEALKAERDALADKCDRLEYNLGNAIVGEQEALQRVNALAVENAALKTAHPQPFGREMMKALDAYEKHQDEVPETGMLDAFFILRDSIRVETTATDAALAAIQAQGVEKLADKLDAEIEQIMRGAFFYDEISSREAIAKMVREYATELREAK
ncbi:hypothetical protein [Serratia bockelmannii]|uniref:hypothetical protein n=1 Tax=Serratia bockelmannii TaxID=2703793 RepID=UPI003C2B97A5